jgi:hypothetical protein
MKDGTRAPFYNPPFVQIGTAGGAGVLGVYFPPDTYIYSGDADSISGLTTLKFGINVWLGLMASQPNQPSGGQKPDAILARGDLQGRTMVKASSHVTVYDGQFARPADTTTYASGDVIGTDATGLIRADQLTPEFAGKDDSVNDLHYFQEYLISDVVVTTNGDPTGLNFDLFIWSSTTDPLGSPVEGAVDNEPFDASVNSTARIIGVLSFVASDAVLLGTGALWQAHGLGLVVPVVVNDTVITAASVWYTLVVRSAYTPADQQIFHVKLGALS